jgi:hypothetical protein
MYPPVSAIFEESVFGISFSISYAPNRRVLFVRCTHRSSGESTGIREDLLVFLLLVDDQAVDVFREEIADEAGRD